MRAALLSCVLSATLALGCSRKPVAAPGPGAPSPPATRATSQILVQPQPVWKHQSPTFNGTGFFLKAGSRLLLLTSAHYFESEVNAVNFWSMQGEPLLQARYSLWGFDEQGVDGAIQDLSSDLVAMALPRLPNGFIALDADPRHFVSPGERVWLPNKQPGSAGHQRVEGRVSEWDPGFIDVDLDHPVDLNSQSGSPIISVTTGKVIGVVSRVGGSQRLRLTPMWAIGTFMLWGDSPDVEQSLLQRTSLRAAPETEITPRFDWPDSDWLMTTIELTEGPPKLVKQTLQVRAKEEGGVQVAARGKDIALFTFDILEHGKQMTEITPTPEFRGLLRKNSPDASDADIDAYVHDRAQDLLAMVSNFSVNWAGQTLKIGTDYERKFQVEVSGVQGTVTETFRAHRVGRCERETYRRCVTVHVRRGFGPAEVARLTAELKLHDKPMQVPDVRYLGTLKFEVDTLVPHLFVMHRITMTDPPLLLLRLDGVDHPEVPESKPLGAGHAAQPTLPADVKLARLQPTTAEETSLAERRASAGPLVLRGPGPEARPVPAPAGAQEVVYSSGALQLRGWLAQAPGAAASPVVVYLHDGFSAKAADWAAAQAFLSRGYSVFVPQFRGESGNPGEFSAFLHEVDDAIAAGSAAAGLPGVDPKRVYLVGKGHGGALALLVAELPNPFAAVAAIDPIEPIRLAFANPLQMPFDTSDVQELAARDPFRFPGDLRTKVLVLSSTAPANRAQEFCAKAGAARCSMGSSDPDAATSAQAIITTWQ